MTTRWCVLSELFTNAVLHTTWGSRAAWSLSRSRVAARCADRGDR